MRLREQILAEARQIVSDELSEPTPDGVVADVARLVESMCTPEDAMALGIMFASLERIRTDLYAHPQTDVTSPDAEPADVGLTD